MRIKITLIFLLFCLFGISQKGTIHVEKNKLFGLYQYKANSGSKTYIRIFKDSMVMMANNHEEPEYMMFWFDRMARDSNLPKGRIQLNGNDVMIRIKVAQSVEDDIILKGMFIDTNKLELKRVGKNVDPKKYIFNKVN